MGISIKNLSRWDSYSIRMNGGVVAPGSSFTTAISPKTPARPQEASKSIVMSNSRTANGRDSSPCQKLRSDGDRMPSAELAADALKEARMMMAPHRKAAAARKMETGLEVATSETAVPDSKVSSMTESASSMMPRAMLPPHRKYAGCNIVTPGPYTNTSPQTKAKTAAQTTSVTTPATLPKNVTNAKLSDENRMEATVKIAVDPKDVVNSKIAHHMKITPKRITSSQLEIAAHVNGTTRSNLASGHKTTSGPNKTPQPKTATNHKTPRLTKPAIAKYNNIPKAANKSIAAEAKVAKLIALQSVEVDETDPEEDEKPFAISSINLSRWDSTYSSYANTRASKHNKATLYNAKKDREERIQRFVEEFKERLDVLGKV